ncbi:response regulator transcription factor [Saccharopolyspora rosea]|uniref:LuxR C-terminal-related transcriptional regulator n=1 Tax=Saccharopolyspora rosea TaxID=524884 RepID=A0ABW3FMN1_9PSEU|nr:response regulator transcription factor [Saccharopolyspora rosea]
MHRDAFDPPPTTVATPPPVDRGASAAMPDSFSRTSPVRVVVASGLGIIRDAITLMLGNHRDIAVVGRADCGESAIELTRRLCPDVVVSYYGLTSEDIPQLVAGANRVRIVVLVTSTEDPRSQHALLASGAYALLDTSATAGDLISSIFAATTMSDGMVTAFVPQTVLSRYAVSEHGSVLSPRQQEVLLHVAKGLSNRQISSRLGLTEGTVKRHLANIYAKLNVRSRTEAIRKALTDHLIHTYEIAGGGD